MTDTPKSLHPIQMPGVHEAASRASRRGRRVYMRLNAIRLFSLVTAAITAAIGLTYETFDWPGLILLFAFVTALLTELGLTWLQPERDWYAGRAIAESTKTLAWRFAVQGEPFGPSLTEREAQTLLRVRIGEILRRGRDRIDITPGNAVVTDSMLALRISDLASRSEAYITFRTREQWAWYSAKAKENSTRKTMWRLLLLSGEVFAVVAAALAFGRHEPADFAGILAATVACGAAWLALKQHSQLTSSYRLAAMELALQEATLRQVESQDWAHAVANAEEAISREHTMWLATRGQEPLPRSQQ